MSLEATLKKITERYKVVSKELMDCPGGSDEYVKLSKEYSDLGEFVTVISEYDKAQKELAELAESLRDENIDAEFKELAEEEQKSLQEKIPQLEKQLKLMLIPKDATDEKNAIIEIRAGTGGDEAGLFGADLLRMYQRYAESKGWRFEMLYSHESELGSIKEAAASISGKGVFSCLKFESGVHRVQRVPVTESAGRVHTSTATVAVLPEAEDVDVKINDTDLKIDVMRASGAGGQHVNKTESAVRITHIPTGIVVFQQDERSQHMNKLKAMKILRARLFDMEQQKLHNERADNRRSQIGTGDRSERIRTYNYPQGRVTDHRINLTLYKLPLIMDGPGLDELIQALIEYDQEDKIASFQDE